MKAEADKKQSSLADAKKKAEAAREQAEKLKAESTVAKEELASDKAMQKDAKKAAGVAKAAATEAKQEKKALDAAPENSGNVLLQVAEWGKRLVSW